MERERGGRKSETLQPHLRYLVDRGTVVVAEERSGWEKTSCALLKRLRSVVSEAGISINCRLKGGTRV